MSKTISCPLCGGEIHAIAGRCKHCKADLVDLRERAARHARAQAMGATVPPSPRSRAYTAPPVPRAPTQPLGSPSGVMAAVPPPAPYEAVGPGPEHDHATTLVNQPGDEPRPSGELRVSPSAEFRVPDYPVPDYRPPESSRPHGAPPPNGAPYGLGFAGGRPHRVSTWSRRWPLVVSAVALLAIGISIGVLAERWRRQAERGGDSKARQSHVSRQPGMIPDHMPQPLMPAPPAPRPVPDTQRPDRDQPRDSDRPDNRLPDPDTQPQAAPPPDQGADPDPSNPGSRFSQPRSSDSRSDAGAFRTFTTSLTESLCQKLTQCGFIDSATQSMCQVFAQELDSEAAADKVARGECSFNRRAADACLQAVADLSCDVGSSDRMWDWLRAPNQVGECADAYVCNPD
jgi:hypothetical protein